MISADSNAQSCCRSFIENSEFGFVVQESFFLTEEPFRYGPMYFDPQLPAALKKKEHSPAPNGPHYSVLYSGPALSWGRQDRAGL